MPELPEVQTVVDTLRPQLLDRTILAIVLRRDDIVAPQGVDLPALLAGRRIGDIHRRAKRIVFTLDDGNCFYIHLGMTGSLILAQPDAPLAKHTHLVIQVDGRPGPGRISGQRPCSTGFQPVSGALPVQPISIGSAHPTRAGSPCYEGSAPPIEVHFCDPRRFGGVWWLGRDLRADDGLGPEPLGMRSGQLGVQMRRTRRAIKTALLDQTLIAGLGNIYADEALFTAGIDPRMPANRLKAEQIRQLAAAIKQVLRRAIRHHGSTIRDYRDANGWAGSFQKLLGVYARTGQPCLHCRAPIQRIVLGGRSTHFCPKCQPRTKASSRKAP